MHACMLSNMTELTVSPLTLSLNGFGDPVVSNLLQTQPGNLDRSICNDSQLAHPRLMGVVLVYQMKHIQITAA